MFDLSTRAFAIVSDAYRVSRFLLWGTQQSPRGGLNPPGDSDVDFQGQGVELRLDVSSRGIVIPDGKVFELIWVINSFGRTMMRIE